MRAIVIMLAITLSGCLSGGGGLFGGGSDTHIPERWPDQASATIHPGTPLYFRFGERDLSQCTAGFMFRSADNQTLYLAVTAHCLHGEEGDVALGDGAYIGSSRGDGVAIDRIGTVVYDGWADGPQETQNDFALVAISNQRGIRDHAHPAVPHWNGPVGIADSQSATPMQQLRAYGASQQRGADHAGVPMEGRLVTTLDGTTYARFDPHPIGGDSGGPLLTWDGQALGLLHGGLTVPATQVVGVNEEVDLFTPLDINVAAARDALPGLELVTWQYSAPATPFGDASSAPSSALPSGV